MITVNVLHACTHTLRPIPGSAYYGHTPEPLEADGLERYGALYGYRCQCGDTVFVTGEQLERWNPDIKLVTRAFGVPITPTVAIEEVR